MLSSVRKLAAIGAGFLICPDNTIHNALPLIASRSPLPWLHIADLVVEEAKQRGFTRLAITGTRYLLDSDVYQSRIQAAGLSYLRPEIPERDDINRIIMDELVYGIFKPDALVCFQRILIRMKKDGCDAAILGCTEIPLLIDATNSPLAVLDSTRLLARAALRRAIS